METARLVTAHELLRATPEAPATIRVRNLQANLHAASDAWGRENRNQPALISVDLGLKDAFDVAASSDRVSADTVHYGTLTKAILQCLREYAKPSPLTVEGANDAPRDILDRIWYHLTGVDTVGSTEYEYAASPVVDTRRLQSLSMTVFFPKASLYGDGVSYRASWVLATDRPDLRSYVMGIHKLRVPTLIGVNDNERLAKQMVVTSVEIDKCDESLNDYAELESVVVKAMEATEFETLEALATHVAQRIMASYHASEGRYTDEYRGWRIKIQMEKPTAVTFADCPVIEIVAGVGTQILP